jgi:hypothetical protein
MNLRKNPKGTREATDNSRPIRLLVGTCPGTKKDAEAMARSQIDRYFDMPERAWLLTKALDDVGYLYEAHEAGEGRSYIDSILDLELEPNSTLTFKPSNGHAVEIIVREKNVLQSLILPEKVSAERESDPRMVPSSKRDMEPYATTGAEWIKVGVAVIALGLLTVTVGGILHKSYDIALQGYDEIAATLPATRLLNLAERSSFPGDSMPSVRSLPISQWQRISTQPLKSDEIVSKLYYKDGRWEVAIKSASGGKNEGEIPADTGGATDTDSRANPSADSAGSELARRIEDARPDHLPKGSTRTSFSFKNGKSTVNTEYMDEEGNVVGRTEEQTTEIDDARSAPGGME